MPLPEFDPKKPITPATAPEPNPQEEQKKLDDLKRAVHGYWDSINARVKDYYLNNEDVADPLYNQGALRGLAVSTFARATTELNLNMTQEQLEKLRQEIIDWSGEKYTELKRAGIFNLKGEITSFEIGEVEEEIGKDDEWKEIEHKFGKDYVDTHYFECIKTYMGDLSVPGKDFGYVNLNYERWTLVLNAREIQEDFLAAPTE